MGHRVVGGATGINVGLSEFAKKTKTIKMYMKIKKTSLVKFFNKT